MDKNIDTLVDDIQCLFRKPHTADPARLTKLSEALAETIGKRLAEERGATYLRMSNLGKGDRQLWYDVNGYPADPGEELSPSAKIKFLFGDILEHLLIFLAEEAGHSVENKQAQVVVDEVPGSIDCTIDGVLVDCKSASTYAFKKFEGGRLVDDDPFGYMEQLAGYSAGLGDLDGAFLVIGKELGHICLDRHSKEELAAYRVRDRIKHTKEVVASEEIPERCYLPKPEGKSGNMVLDVNCSYCPHKKKCWAGVNNGVGLRTFAYASGPKHFVEVKKEPEVYEITF